MSALDDLLSDIRHDAGCSADIEDTFSCRCRRDARVNEARMELAALRAKVAELERSRKVVWRRPDDTEGRSGSLWVAIAGHGVDVPCVMPCHSHAFLDDKWKARVIAWAPRDTTPPPFPEHMLKDTGR